MQLRPGIPLIIYLRLSFSLLLGNSEINPKLCFSNYKWGVMFPHLFNIKLFAWQLHAESIPFYLKQNSGMFYDTSHKTILHHFLGVAVNSALRFGNSILAGRERCAYTARETLQPGLSTYFQLCCPRKSCEASWAASRNFCSY